MALRITRRSALKGLGGVADPRWPARSTSCFEPATARPTRRASPSRSATNTYRRLRRAVARRRRAIRCTTTTCRTPVGAELRFSRSALAPLAAVQVGGERRLGPDDPDGQRRRRADGGAARRLPRLVAVRRSSRACARPRTPRPRAPTVGSDSSPPRSRANTPVQVASCYRGAGRLVPRRPRRAYGPRHDLVQGGRPGGQGPWPHRPRRQPPTTPSRRCSRTSRPPSTTAGPDAPGLPPALTQERPRPSWAAGCKSSPRTRRLGKADQLRLQQHGDEIRALENQISALPPAMTATCPEAHGPPARTRRPAGAQGVGRGRHEHLRHEPRLQRRGDPRAHLLRPSSTWPSACDLSRRGLAAVHDVPVAHERVRAVAAAALRSARSSATTAIRVIRGTLAVSR